MQWVDAAWVGAWVANSLRCAVDPRESQQPLVAFALGMTLFILTLGLNVIALHIVRKYREQYE